MFGEKNIENMANAEISFSGQVIQAPCNKQVMDYQSWVLPWDLTFQRQVSAEKWEYWLLGIWLALFFFFFKGDSEKQR